MRWAVLIVALYSVISVLVDPLQMAQVLTLVLIGVVVGVLLKYGRQVRDSVLSDDMSGRSQLATGILVGFAGLGIGLAWSIVGRVVPGAEWMQRSPVVGFYLLCYIVAGSLHMTAGRDSLNHIPRRDLWLLLSAIGAGLVISIVLSMLQLSDVLRRV